MRHRLSDLDNIWYNRCAKNLFGNRPTINYKLLMFLVLVVRLDCFLITYFDALVKLKIQLMGKIKRS